MKPENLKELFKSIVCAGKVEDWNNGREYSLDSYNEDGKGVIRLYDDYMHTAYDITLEHLQNAKLQDNRVTTKAYIYNTINIVTLCISLYTMHPVRVEDLKD